MSDDPVAGCGWSVTDTEPPVSVLVIAANTEWAASVASTLESTAEPLAVEVETDVGRASERVESDATDCLVCQTGWVRRLRSVLEAECHRAATPPIVCWGLGSDDDPTTALDAGANDVVETPLEENRCRLVARRVRTFGERFRAERSAATYRSIFETLPDAVVVHDQAGEYLDMNREVSELLGYDRETLSEMTVAEIDSTLTADELEQVLSELEPGETKTIESRNERIDGTELPVRVSLRRIDDGTETRIIASVRDLSELKARERDLERSLDLLEKTEQIANAGGWELDLHRDELRWTDGTRRIHGVDDEYEPTTDDALDFYHPSDRARIDAVVQRAIEAGTPFDETARVETIDGTVRQVHTRGEPYRKDGETVRLRGSIWDVTDRKEAEAELRQREAHLSQAQSVADLGSWHKDIPSDEIYWSDEVCEIFELERRDEPIDHELFLAHVHPEDREAVDIAWENAKRGAPYDVEHRIVTGSGTTKWVRQKAELTLTEDGPISAIGVVQDVTDRKEYERRLETQTEQLEILNRILRHDMRNRINVIDGYAAVLEDRLDEDRPLATSIRAVADELVSISEEVRTANQLVAADTDVVPLPLEPLVEDAFADVCDEFDEFECERSIEPGVLIWGTDAVRIALENVIENAIEHNDAPTPRIEISAEERAADDVVVVRIADNGPGIPRAERELLCGDRERSQLEHSSGLGLWIVNWIVSSVDGDLAFEERDDGGTVVILRFPRVEPMDVDLSV